MNNKYLSIFLLMVVFYSTSCVNTRKYNYFDESKDANIIPNAADTIKPAIQKNDILSIIITSLNPEASAIFNMNPTMSAGVTTSAGGGQLGTGYLVNEDGNVQLPILGNIKVAGLTTKMVKENITSIILQKKLLTDPIVTIRHLNYEITVIGEVNKPTVITVPNEKISLVKALGLAGDITVYGKKDNVLLIREISGKRTVKRIDLNDPEFLSSPNYYLQPNDVVYVETNKNKLISVSALRQTLPIILSSLSVLLIVLDRLVR